MITHIDDRIGTDRIITLLLSDDRITFRYDPCGEVPKVDRARRIIRVRTMPFVTIDQYENAFDAFGRFQDDLYRACGYLKEKGYGSLTPLHVPYRESRDKDGHLIQMTRGRIFLAGDVIPNHARIGEVLYSGDVMDFPSDVVFLI
jgi:hypothetical protein